MFKFISGFIKLSAVVFLIYYVGNPAYQTYQKTRDVVLAVQASFSQAQKALSEANSNFSTRGDPKIPEAKVDVAVLEARLKEVGELKVMELFGTIEINTSINGPNKEGWRNLPFIGSPNSGEASFTNQVQITGHVSLHLNDVIVKQEAGQVTVILPAPKILMSPLAWQTKPNDNGTIDEAEKAKLNLLTTLSNRENDQYFYNLFFKSKAVSPQIIDKIAKQTAKQSLEIFLTKVVPAETNVRVISDTPVTIVNGYYTQKDTNSVFNPFGLSELTSAGLNSQIKKVLFSNNPKAVVSTLPSVSNANFVLKSTQSDTDSKQP